METTNQMECAMNSTQKPTHEIRLGAIKAAIWKNETTNGTRYNVTVSRLYRDGDQWKSTESFGRDDLLLVAKVADQAHTWIFHQGQEAEKPPKAASTQGA
jgi:hypothetical protein